MTTLVRCSTCNRHIYVSESACPFCARNAGVTSSGLVALTAAASIALAGCSTDPPKTDAPTQVAPETPKTVEPRVVPVPTPVAPATTPVAASSEPNPAPSASTVPTTPVQVPTTPVTTRTRPPAPAYGVPPPPTTNRTEPKRPPSSAYGAPPPAKNGVDPLSPR